MGQPEGCPGVQFLPSEEILHNNDILSKGYPSRNGSASAHAARGDLANESTPSIFSLAMAQSSESGRRPTAGLLFGLVLTLAAVLVFAYYMTGQLRGLRALQSNMVDRNRKDSLELLRVQNDLNSLALAMRDMLDAREPYPLTAWTAQFDRIRADFDAALKIEDSF